MSTDLTTSTPAAEAVLAVDRRAYLESLPSPELQVAAEQLGDAAEDARAVRKARMELLAADGMTQRAIAAEFGCTHATVNRILNDKTGNEARGTSTYQDTPTDLADIRDLRHELSEQAAQLHRRIAELDDAEDASPQMVKLRRGVPISKAEEALVVDVEVVDAEPVEDDTDDDARVRSVSGGAMPRVEFEEGVRKPRPVLAEPFRQIATWARSAQQVVAVRGVADPESAVVECREALNALALLMMSIEGSTPR